MEIKFKLDTNKVARATITIAVSLALGHISEGIEYPQLASDHHHPDPLQQLSCTYCQEKYSSRLQVSSATPKQH
jgi:hypothetical protein